MISFGNCSVDGERKTTTRYAFGAVFRLAGEETRIGQLTLNTSIKPSFTSVFVVVSTCFVTQFFLPFFRQLPTP
jgi:hypothetical protein